MYAYNNPINSYSLQFVAAVGAYLKVIDRFSFQPEHRRNLDVSGELLLDHNFDKTSFLLLCS